MKILGWIARHRHLFVLLAVCVLGFAIGIADSISLKRQKAQPKEVSQDSEEQISLPSVSDSYEPSFDDIGFVGLQIETVSIDMKLYLGWAPDEIDMVKKAPEAGFGAKQKRNPAIVMTGHSRFFILRIRRSGLL